MPAEIALGRFGFGDARLPHAAVERLQLLTGMIAFVGGESAGLVLGWRKPDRARDCARRLQGSAKASSYRLRRPDGSARPPRRPCRDRPHALACRPDASFHPSSSRSWRQNRSGSSSQRSTASCLCACGRSAPNPPPSASRRRSLGHPRQHFAIALAIVAANDGAQRRVGLHGRAVDAEPLAVHKTPLGYELQDPAKHLLMRLVRQTRTGPRQPGMIGGLLEFESRRKSRRE